MKKVIEVPFVAGLSDKPLAQVSEILETQGVRQAIDCVDWPNEFPYKPIVSFSIARDNQYLYIDYFVRGNYLLAVNSTDNSPVWQDSCVEFFIQIPGEKYYYNFEFNCIGTALAARRTSRSDAEHFSPEKMARIKRYSTVGNKPFREMEGLFTWGLLVAIPFDLVGLDGEHLPEAVAANFYKCADGSSLPHYLSWSPIPVEKPDFHRPEYFGELRFK